MSEAIEEKSVATSAPEPQKEEPLLGADKSQAVPEPPPAVKPEPVEQEITIKIPDGITADKSALDEFKSIAKASGIKSEGAQKIVDLFIKTQNATTAAIKNNWDKQQESWTSSAKADKEFGGANFEQNISIANKAFDQFSSPELKEYLQSTGLGNHPELIRAFYRAGKAISEDSISGAQSTGKGAKELHALLYPSMVNS